MIDSDEPQVTRSTPEEQWHVVPPTQQSRNELAHHWRLVQLSSNLGRTRPGLHCPDCGEIKVLNSRQVAGRGGRGVEWTG